MCAAYQNHINIWRRAEVCCIGGCFGGISSDFSGTMFKGSERRVAEICDSEVVGEVVQD